jgi:hypothetical protein
MAGGQSAAKRAGPNTDMPIVDPQTTCRPQAKALRALNSRRPQRLGRALCVAGLRARVAVFVVPAAAADLFVFAIFLLQGRRDRSFCVAFPDSRLLGDGYLASAFWLRLSQRLPSYRSLCYPPELLAGRRLAAPAASAHIPPGIPPSLPRGTLRSRSSCARSVGTIRPKTKSHCRRSCRPHRCGRHRDRRRRHRSPRPATEMREALARRKASCMGGAYSDLERRVSNAASSTGITARRNRFTEHHAAIEFKAFAAMVRMGEVRSRPVGYQRRDWGFPYRAGHTDCTPPRRSCPELGA